jgi:RHS repeat-associated protein
VETVLPITIDPFGYNAKWGYYYDRETQLYLCQHRMYDASAGRWLNRDPIGYAGGVNLYGYCAGGPVGSADSSGKMPRNIIDGFLKMERCAQLLEQIREMQGELTKRFYDMFNDPKSLFPFDPNPNPQYPGSGTWSGHQGQYRAKQIYLQRLLEEYSKLGCGNGRPPRNAHKQSRRPAPDHPGQPVPYLMEGCEGYDPSAPMSDMPTSFPTAAYPTFRSDVFDNLGAPSFTPLPAPTFGPLPIPIPI